MNKGGYTEYLNKMKNGGCTKPVNKLGGSKGGGSKKVVQNSNLLKEIFCKKRGVKDNPNIKKKENK